jgi:hypothetical protein
MQGQMANVKVSRPAPKRPLWLPSFEKDDFDDDAELYFLRHQLSRRFERYR